MILFKGPVPIIRQGEIIVAVEIGLLIAWKESHSGGGGVPLQADDVIPVPEGVEPFFHIDHIPIAGDVHAEDHLFRDGVGAFFPEIPEGEQAPFLPLISLDGCAVSVLAPEGQIEFIVPDHEAQDLVHIVAGDFRRVEPLELEPQFPQFHFLHRLGLQVDDAHLDIRPAIVPHHPQDHHQGQYQERNLGPEPGSFLFLLRHGQNSQPPLLHSIQYTMGLRQGQQGPLHREST